jgi:hypothetical protein
MRGRAFRRHQEKCHQTRRFDEYKQKMGRRYSNFDWLKREYLRLKEQPKRCSCYMCCNPRRNKWNKADRLTIQERRFEAGWSSSVAR